MKKRVKEPNDLDIYSKNEINCIPQPDVLAGLAHPAENPVAQLDRASAFLSRRSCVRVAAGSQRVTSR